MKKQFVLHITVDEEELRKIWPAEEEADLAELVELEANWMRGVRLQSLAPYVSKEPEEVPYGRTSN